MDEGRQDRGADDILVEGEGISATARLHEMVFVFPLFVLLLAWLAGTFFHPLMGGLILFLDIYPLSNALIRYKTTQIVLTNKRVFLTFGFFNKDLIQFRFDKIESASEEAPLLGRIFGYSTVIIRGTGTGAVPITMVRGGTQFVRAVEKKLLEGEG